MSTTSGGDAAYHIHSDRTLGINQPRVSFGATDSAAVCVGPHRGDSHMNCETQ